MMARWVGVLRGEIIDKNDESPIDNPKVQPSSHLAPIHENPPSNCKIFAIPEGVYTVEIKAPGYKDFKEEGVEILAGGPLERRPFKMEKV